jgi:NitT/TauT family transport system substrate-binding protein
MDTMIQRLRNHATIVLLTLTLSLTAFLGGACGETTTPPDPTGGLRPVTVAFAYIPNVQFAPYYVAMSKGYYTEAGLEVDFRYMYENEAVQMVSQGAADFGFLSGISVLLARQNDMPVVTVATITQKFPVVYFSKARYPLESVDDLEGKIVGFPGRFGASYYGLLALLYASDLDESNLELHEIGFNQVEMILEDKVQVAHGYAMNEPVQLRSMGEEISVLRVADVYPLVSDGIITNEPFLLNHSETVRAFVQATLRGLQDTLANPDEAFELSLEHIPEADMANVELQRQVLEATLEYWKSDRLGYSDPAVWQATYTFLRDSQLLTKDQPLEESFTNEFVE